MLRFLFIIAAVAWGVCISHANAADIWSPKGANVESVTTTTEPGNPFAGLYFGVDAGYQFTDIAISMPGSGYDEAFDGISADGATAGVHGGLNACVNRLCFGGYGEGGWMDVTTTVADYDVLTFDTRYQVGGLVGVRTGSTLWSIHAGYEQQFGEFSLPMGEGESFKRDITTSWLALGVGVDTYLAQGVTFGIKLDYLSLLDVDAGDTGEVDVYDFVKDSEALVARLRLTYRPQIDLPALN
jgi:hypothetical protein